MSDNKPCPRFGRLDTMAGIRGELAKLYKQARRGDVEVGDATKFAFILRTLAEMVASERLEGRIGDLEETAKQAGFGIRSLTSFKKVA